MHIRLLSSQQYDGIFNLSIRLESLANISEYLITVSPPPPYGPDEIITRNTSVNLSFKNTTLYIITISFSACPEKSNTTFEVGEQIHV